MATIIEFRSQDRSPASGSRSAGRGSAEIVFFPGVRYERWTDEPPTEAPKVKKGRSRDRMELED